MHVALIERRPPLSSAASDAKEFALAFLREPRRGGFFVFTAEPLTGPVRSLSRFRDHAFKSHVDHRLGQRMPVVEPLDDADVLAVQLERLDEGSSRTPDKSDVRGGLAAARSALKPRHDSRVSLAA